MFSAVQLVNRTLDLGGHCFYCGGPVECFDHFRPLYLGGRDVLENLVPSCGDCNDWKGRKDPYDFILEMALSDSGEPSWRYLRHRTLGPNASENMERYKAMVRELELEEKEKTDAIPEG